MINLLGKIAKYKKMLLLLKLVISIGLLIYLAKLVDWSKFSQLGAESFSGVFFGVLIYLIMLAFLAIRWAKLLALQIKEKFSLIDAYNGYLIGMFFNIFMPGTIGGDVIRAKYSADKVRISFKTSVLVVLVERVLGFTALLVIIGVGIFFNLSALSLLEVEFAEMMLTLISLFAGLAVVKYLFFKYVRIDCKTFLLVFFLSIIPHVANVLCIYAIVLGLDLDISFSILLFVTPLVQIATLLPISLGGLGVREGVLVGLLALFGVNVSDGIIVSFMLFMILLIVGLLGLPQSLSILKFKKYQKMEKSY